MPTMAETTGGSRENYTKVVMQKSLCVPLLASWEDRWGGKTTPEINNPLWGVRVELVI